MADSSGLKSTQSQSSCFGIFGNSEAIGDTNDDDSMNSSQTAGDAGIFGGGHISPKKEDSENEEDDPFWDDISVSPVTSSTASNIMDSSQSPPRSPKRKKFHDEVDNKSDDDDISEKSDDSNETRSRKRLKPKQEPTDDSPPNSSPFNTPEIRVPPGIENELSDSSQSFKEDDDEQMDGDWVPYVEPLCVSPTTRSTSSSTSSATSTSTSSSSSSSSSSSRDKWRSLEISIPSQSSTSSPSPSKYKTSKELAMTPRTAPKTPTSQVSRKNIDDVLRSISPKNVPNVAKKLFEFAHVSLGSDAISDVFFSVLYQKFDPTMSNLKCSAQQYNSLKIFLRQVLENPNKQFTKKKRSFCAEIGTSMENLKEWIELGKNLGSAPRHRAKKLWTEMNHDDPVRIMLLMGSLNQFSNIVEARRRLKDDPKNPPTPSIRDRFFRKLSNRILASKIKAEGILENSVEYQSTRYQQIILTSAFVMLCLHNSDLRPLKMLVCNALKQQEHISFEILLIISKYCPEVFHVQQENDFISRAVQIILLEKRDILNRTKEANSQMNKDVSLSETKLIELEERQFRQFFEDVGWAFTVFPPVTNMKNLILNDTLLAIRSQKEDKYIKNDECITIPLTDVQSDAIVALELLCCDQPWSWVYNDLIRKLMGYVKKVRGDFKQTAVLIHAIGCVSTLGYCYSNRGASRCMDLIRTSLTQHLSFTTHLSDQVELQLSYAYALAHLRHSQTKKSVKNWWGNLTDETKNKIAPRYKEFFDGF